MERQAERREVLLAHLLGHIATRPCFATSALCPVSQQVSFDARDASVTDGLAAGTPTFALGASTAVYRSRATISPQCSKPWRS